MKTYTLTVSVPVLVRVSVDAESVDDAQRLAVYAPDTDMVIDAARMGTYDRRNVQVKEIEVEGKVVPKDDAPADCCRCVQRFGSEKRGGIEHEGHNLCSSCFFELAVAKHEF
jgi:hypothetical protein